MKPNLSCSWLYTHFLGIGANFCLKCKKVSNDTADPDLNQGCTYFVEEREYKEYLKNYVKETEQKSTCSHHNAVNLSETNPDHEHATTGTGTIECARHNMKCPNAVGDLQKGERYIHLFLSLLNQ
ncbi:hypothetical protein L208DRAFT_1333247 [Tricholoma matsutake]|nr:hypothetical protein L208DRAFT_1333247 [Tricholoma matsutake 945]